MYTVFYKTQSEAAGCWCWKQSTCCDSCSHNAQSHTIANAIRRRRCSFKSR